MLPQPLIEALEQALGNTPQQIHPIGGGFASSAARFVANSQPYLVKWFTRLSPSPPTGWPDVFAAEAYGLQLLTTAQTVRVPHVYAHAAQQDACPAFIVMEWIEAGPAVDHAKAAEALGHGLAALHCVSAVAFGLDQHNYCGATPQANTWTSSWSEFYGQQRIGFQMELAAQQGHPPASRRRRLERLIERLGDWIDDAVRPSLLHGDLWGGNWLVDAAGEPVLIDPAVYFGDREAELAMCQLFGGFPPAFFRAYDVAWPPVPGRDERVPLYQLYHLLNHLNLFGETYGAQVDRVLQRYVGE
jgi:fructosamine-3-kinase